jgi:molybdopterin-guanine dinucleotide biosynthesis protein A
MRPDSGDSGPARRCAILAGGLGTRLGGSKAGVELAGRPLVSHPIASAEAAGLIPVVVAKRSSPLPDLDAAVLIEPEQPRHPLLGVATALARAAEPIVVCPCDAPLIPPKLLAWLAGREEELVVLDSGDRLQPLIGRYAPSLEGALSEAAAGGEPAIGAISALGPRVVGADELRQFGDPSLLALNVNAPADLDRAAAALGG